MEYPDFMDTKKQAEDMDRGGVAAASARCAEIGFDLAFVAKRVQAAASEATQLAEIWRAVSENLLGGSLAIDERVFSRIVQWEGRRPGPNSRSLSKLMWFRTRLSSDIQFRSLLGERDYWFFDSALSRLADHRNDAVGVLKGMLVTADENSVDQQVRRSVWLESIAQLAEKVELLERDAAALQVLAAELYLSVDERSPRNGEQMKFDVGIITMKEEEYSALIDALDVKVDSLVKGKHRDYATASVVTDEGNCNVAIARCLQQGNAHAQNAAVDLLDDLSPSWILVVGIAGGRPTPDYTLGDVLVSNYIQDLSIEDTGTGKSKYDAFGGPLHPRASKLLEQLPLFIKSMAEWSGGTAIAEARPETGGQHTTELEDWNKDIDNAFTYHKESSRKFPIARLGKIASSDRLVKDPELLREWRNVVKSVAAVEMESAGVYVHTHSRNVPAIAIRGISDIVGWKRSEAWTKYACHTAAVFTNELLKTGALMTPSDLAEGVASYPP